MDPDQSLSIESFSYSWLVNVKSSMEGSKRSFRASVDASDDSSASSFIEVDPRMPPYTGPDGGGDGHQDFTFAFPSSLSSHALVHAEEVFSNGILMPVFVERSKVKAVEGGTEGTGVCSGQPALVVSSRKFRSSALRRFRSFSRQVLRKYLDILRPLLRRAMRPRAAKNVDGPDTSDTSNKKRKKNNWVRTGKATPAATPRSGLAYTSTDTVCAINEAIQYCKRSFGK